MTDTPEAPPAPRQGKPWSEEEDRQLYASFIAGKPLELIVASHERAAGGITSRLKRLGLLGRKGEIIDPPPPFTLPQRRAAASVTPEAVKKAAAMDVAFAVTSVDGWKVEIRSNRTLEKPLIERLVVMLEGAVGGP